jgi:poly(3-hydroxybutyrate) depolymerase
MVFRLPAAAWAGASAAGSATAAELPAGTHRLLVDAPGLGVSSEPVPVHLHRPTAWRTDDPVVLVMHGVQRDADRYLASWRSLADDARVLVAVPEFTRSKFPTRTHYNFGNVVDERMQPVPRERWSFQVLDRVFATLRAATGARSERFALYGHSAGAQFVHRYMLLADADRATPIVVAKAGSWTVPDAAVPFPWGLAGTAVDDADLRRAFARPVVVALGDADTDPAAPNLPNDPHARAQGPHRLARGRYFFEACARKAAALGAPFRWRQVTVPGAGHVDAQMAPTALRIIRDT